MSKKKHYIIYETKNLKNNMIYVGMHETNDIEDGYLGSGKRLKQSIKYHGKEFFERKILFELESRDEMIAKEIELVNEDFVNRKDTYNLKKGGEGGICNKVHLRKFRESNSRGGKKGIIKANEIRLNKLKNDPIFYQRYCSIMKEVNNRPTAGFNGKLHSKETKLKMSSVDRKGIKNSQYNTCWMTKEKSNKDRKSVV